MSNAKIFAAGHSVQVVPGYPLPASGPQGNVTIYDGGDTVQVIVGSPPAAARIPAIGSNMHSQQFNGGPADWIDPTKLPPPIPWTTYTDASNLILAPSQNGVRPAKWRRLSLCGNANGLYSCTPIVRNGRVEQWNGQVGDDPWTMILPSLASDPPPDGARGAGLPSAYMVWHGHRTIFEAGAIENPMPTGTLTTPLMPFHIGIRMDGAVYYLTRDAQVKRVLTIPGCSAVHDFTYYPPNGSFFFVADTQRTGNNTPSSPYVYKSRIIKIDRTAAKAARGTGLEDPALWVVSELVPFSAGLQFISSLRCLDDGTMYACDNVGNRIVLIDEDTGAITTALSTIGPFWIDYRSDQKIVFTNLNAQVFLWDKNAAPILISTWPAGAKLFNQISVDRKGTVGPVNEVWYVQSHGSGNIDMWQIRTDGTVLYYTSLFPSIGHATVGEARVNSEPQGHYPWVVDIHPDEGIVIMQGFGNGTLSVLRPLLTSDAVEDVYDTNLFRRGWSIIRAGTVATQPLYSKPSFTSLMNEAGWSLLGCSADYIAEMTYANAKVFIQGGMIGSFPRPEIVGYDLMAVMYFFYRSSQRFLREGKPLIDGLRAFCGNPAASGVDPTTSNTPVDWDTAIFVQAVSDTTGITVHFTDVGMNPLSPEAVSVRVLADEGMPSQIDLGTQSNPWKFSTASLASGPHALTCKISGGTKKYYNRTTTIER